MVSEALHKVNKLRIDHMSVQLEGHATRIRDDASRIIRVASEMMRVV